MTKKVYTNYWVNKNTGVRKEHGTYASEEEAIRGIEAWWDIHGEFYPKKEGYRTNSGAWEIKYGDQYCFYRVESRTTDEDLPKVSYKLMNQNEIDSLRKSHQLDEEEFLFDELAEPYRDKLVLAYNNIDKLRGQIYSQDGKPITSLER